MHPYRLMLTVTLLLAALILCACQPIQLPMPRRRRARPRACALLAHTSWRTSTPEEQGFDSEKIVEGVRLSAKRISRSTACW